MANGDYDYHPTHPDLNGALSAEDQDSLSAFLRGEEVTVVETMVGGDVGVVFVESTLPTSVQSVEESERLSEERGMNLGD